ncbi:MAG: hypothetical protein ACJAZA_000643 [Shewanella psychromarinicola]|jgi:hypothetical protein
MLLLQKMAGYVFLEADMAPLINELKDSLDGQ